MVFRNPFRTESFCLNHFVEFSAAEPVGAGSKVRMPERPKQNGKKLGYTGQCTRPLDIKPRNDSTIASGMHNMVCNLLLYGSDAPERFHDSSATGEGWG